MYACNFECRNKNVLYGFILFAGDSFDFTSSGGGGVAKLLACGERGLGFDSRSRHLNSKIGYLLFPSREMAEIPLKRRKSSVQPTDFDITAYGRRSQSKEVCILPYKIATTRDIKFLSVNQSYIKNHSLHWMIFKGDSIQGIDLWLINDPFFPWHGCLAVGHILRTMPANLCAVEMDWNIIDCEHKQGFFEVFCGRLHVTCLCNWIL